VNAGPDQTIMVPEDVALDGTVTDDGLPRPPSLLTSWSKASGPGTVTFDNALAVDTRASFGAAGSYQLVLSANDGELATRDTVEIVALPPPNEVPVVNAGPDLSITLPNDVALDGTVVDDGQPLPPRIVTLWRQLVGQGTVTFVDAHALGTRASFSAAGTYHLTLTASDGELSARDTVEIVVHPAPPPPPVVATVEKRVAASADDAEEESTGKRQPGQQRPGAGDRRHAAPRGGGCDSRRWRSPLGRRSRGRISSSWPTRRNRSPRRSRSAARRWTTHRRSWPRPATWARDSRTPPRPRCRGPPWRRGSWAPRVPSSARRSWRA
jgi:hypothetical protein